jgi:tetratricopeptide (TPR) repeat protein
MNAIPSESREELEKLERRHAENPEGRYFVPLANAYRRVGEIERAVTLLREGLGRHPDYLSAHIVMGRCLVDRGDPEAAAAEFRFVLDLDPQNLIALRTLGEIALEGGRDDDAAKWFGELLGVDPMNEDARRALDALSAAGRAETPAAPESPAPPDEEPLPQPDASALPEHETLPQPESDPVHAENDRETEEHPAARPAAATAGEPRRFGGPHSEDEPDDDFSFGDSEVVVTETIAELYTRQGFYGRAAEVYRELIRQRGEDPRLSERLERVEGMDRGETLDRLPEPSAAGSETPTPPNEAGARPTDAGLLSATSSWRDAEPDTGSVPARSGGESDLPTLDEEWARALGGGEDDASESQDAEPLPTLDESHPLPALQADSFASSFEDVFGETGADEPAPVDRAVDAWVGGESAAAPADTSAASGERAAPAGGGSTIRDLLRGVTAWHPSSVAAAGPDDEGGSARGAGAAPAEGTRSAADEETSTDGDADAESWRVGGSAWDDLQGDPLSDRPDADDPVSLDHGVGDLAGLPSLGSGDAVPGRTDEMEELFPWEVGGESPLTTRGADADADPDPDADAARDAEGSGPDDSAYDGSLRHREQTAPAGESDDRSPVTRDPPSTGGSGDGLELDDDLESFQAWLRSLKR